MHSTRLLLATAALVALGAGTLRAAPWKLVLKDGRTFVCEAPPIVIDGTCLFRGIDGVDDSLPADQIDADKTGLINKVVARPHWREIGRSQQILHPGAAGPSVAPSAVPLVSVGGGNVLTLGDSNFEAEVLRSRVPVLVDFWATWCGPCRMIAPTVDALAGQYAGRVKVGRLDVDQSMATAVRCRVHAYPTLLLFQDGVVVGKIVGGAGKNEIAQMIDAHL